MKEFYNFASEKLSDEIENLPREQKSKTEDAYRSG